MRTKHPGWWLALAGWAAGCGGVIGGRAVGDDGDGAGWEPEAGTAGSGDGRAQTMDGAAGAEDAGSALAPDVGRTHPTDFVFDDGKLMTWRFTITAGDLQMLDAQAAMEVYVPAMLQVDGESVGRVGIRYKGSFGTLFGCIEEGKIICKKLSYKVDFGEYVPAVRFHGLKKINLHSLTSDPTYLHERLAYQLFRAMSIPAPRSVHGKVYVNGVYKGLFAATEEIDGRFTDYWFAKGEGDGNLYKEAWPLSDDPQGYVDSQTTNEGMVPPTKILAGAKAMMTASAADLPKVVDAWLDTDYMLRLLAVDRATSNWDGPLRFYSPNATRLGSNHNFFVYESQTADRLWVFPWDLDNTFRVFTSYEMTGPWNDSAPDCSQNLQIDRYFAMRPACDRIFKGLSGAGRARYAKAIDQLLAGPFVLGSMRADLDRWAAQISDAVKADSNGPGFDVWQRAFAGYKRDLALLREKMVAIRDGMDPLPYTLKVNTVAGFEGVKPLAAVMGVNAAATERSTADQALNRLGALAGTTDLMMNFELRNSTDDATGAFAQRAFVWFRLDRPVVDLRQLRALGIRLKTDGPRTVRIEIGSLYYKPSTGRPPTLGWDVSASATTQSLSLPVANLSIPAGTVPVGDVLSDVLAGVMQISVIVEPNSRDPITGLMPPGASEKGWLQVDDVTLLTN